MMGTDEFQRLLDGQGRLMSLPKKTAPRQAALRWLLGNFLPGCFYTEKAVNEQLAVRSATGDYALLRRELFESGLLSRTRNGSRYWRTDFLPGAGDCGGYALRGLAAEDAAHLLAIHGTLGEYDALSGHTFTPADAQAIIGQTDLPPNGSSEFFSARLIIEPATGKAVGYLACYAGYPEAGQLWIGSFFLRREYHGQGIGSAVMRVVESEARRGGFTRLGLGVYAQNTAGLRFWIGQGFRSIDRLVEREGQAILCLSKGCAAES